MVERIKAQVALIESGLAKDEEHARSLLSCGLVFVGDKKLDTKSLINKEDIIAGKLRVKYSKQYVSRGAKKLESIFSESSLDVTDLVCADIGASTGGFTQLLLEKGASFVFAVDVGKGIIDHKLRTDKRVKVLEGINARFFDTYDDIKSNIKKGSLDLVVFDLSFISLKKVIGSVMPYVKSNGYVIPLVKPQFEAAKENIKKGGLVDINVVDPLLNDMKDFFETNSLKIQRITASNIKGPTGNQEYFYIMIKK